MCCAADLTPPGLLPHMFVGTRYPLSCSSACGFLVNRSGVPLRKPTVFTGSEDGAGLRGGNKAESCARVRARWVGKEHVTVVPRCTNRSEGSLSTMACLGLGVCEVAGRP